ncbi:MAG: hypothetical protein A2X77_03945 [Gammaproteobacteria bacterium GWE2_42_36]|nr:MAG: hypothetical protein A2X77_03945 [Gammaproteobacteria bacterium GWE2_42_36]HCU04981.1 carbon storage regulator [Coxiellaceae bacterium]
MLVLSRKTGQSLVIGGQIEIITLDIQKNRVRLGIRAPKEILVDRMETIDQHKKKQGNYSDSDGENIKNKKQE